MERPSSIQHFKKFLQDIKDVFVNTSARRRQYANHLKEHGIMSPCKILLPNATRWNSWFRIVCYAKDHIDYWPSFFEAELQDNIRNEKLAKIQSILQNVREKGIITIYIHFISNFSKEFVRTLDFFQQKNTPVFPFVELQLQQLNSYLESNRISSDFGFSLEHLILTLPFNPIDFYPIFQVAFEAAFAKFSLHISNHPARELFKACQIFDPAYFFYSDVGRKNIRLYSIINGFDNPSNELLREWFIYCGQQWVLDDTGIEGFWLRMVNQLPLLSNIALDYIWLPISSCTVERSFLIYNTILDDDYQNLSLESLKALNMMHFNLNFK
ncbi:hypothetical protein C1645_816677 [Glomus cerebriforme]|uniref:HAT C-terminal dimerisation domain-containing protein n=1 Tax=Glomus cerebriforme TaxID=658196 RepID=A0A397TB32_9GLOM|nr:hypothetical protein C1645_816677 [Glomus cerebriforme]